MYPAFDALNNLNNVLTNFHQNWISGSLDLSKNVGVAFVLCVPVTMHMHPTRRNRIHVKGKC